MTVLSSPAHHPTVLPAPAHGVQPARPGPRLAADAGRPRARHARHPARLVGHLDPRRPHRRRPQRLPAQAARQRRHRPGADGRRPRHRPPVGAHPRAAGLPRQRRRARHGPRGRQHHQRVALVDPARRHVHPARGVREAAVSSAWRSSSPNAPNGGGDARRSVEVSSCSRSPGCPPRSSSCSPTSARCSCSPPPSSACSPPPAPRLWLTGPGRRRVGGALARSRRGAQGVPDRRFMPSPIRRSTLGRRLQHRAGAHRVGNGGSSARALRRLADPLRLRARAHTDFIFTVAGEGSASWAPASSSSLAGRADLARAGHLHPRPRPVRPCRGAGIACWFGLPGLPEHRHVPGHHALTGSRCRSCPTAGPRCSPGCSRSACSRTYSSLREASQRAVVKPFVDFSALDVVG